LASLVKLPPEKILSSSYWQSRGYTLKIYLSGAKTNSSPFIENLFKKYINPKTVHITYNFTDKQQEYEKFDIFANPSIQESLGIVNFEAIFNFLPTIVHRQSPFSDFLPSQSFKTISKLHKLLIQILIQSSYKQTAKKQFSTLDNFNLNKFQSQLYKAFKQK